MNLRKCISDSPLREKSIAGNLVTKEAYWAGYAVKVGEPNSSPYVYKWVTTGPIKGLFFKFPLRAGDTYTVSVKINNAPAYTARNLLINGYLTSLPAGSWTSEQVNAKNQQYSKMGEVTRNGVETFTFTPTTNSEYVLIAINFWNSTALDDFTVEEFSMVQGGIALSPWEPSREAIYLQSGVSLQN